MDALNNYISFRYPNWLDYANYQARVHKFDGWAEDLLNDVILDLLGKNKDFLNGLMERKTRKIVNGKPTTELDKFVLRMLHLNAFSPVAPFRKNTMGNKIIARGPGNQVQVKYNTELNNTDREDETYCDELNCRLDAMHARNLHRLKRNGFNNDAVLLYHQHFIFNAPLDHFPEHEQENINIIRSFLLIQKTLLDD